MLGVAVALAVLFVWFVCSIFGLEFSINVVNTIAFVLFYVVNMLTIYRLFMWLFPLEEGEVEEGSQQEFVYGVHSGFYLILFNALILTYTIPIRLKRLIYLALGAKLGQGTYPAGILPDGLFIEVGRNATIGAYSMLIPHVMEDRRLAYYRIRLGDKVIGKY